MHKPLYPWSGSVNWCLAEGQGNGDQRRPMGRCLNKLDTWSKMAFTVSFSKMCLCFLVDQLLTNYTMTDNLISLEIELSYRGATLSELLEF